MKLYLARHGEYLANDYSQGEVLSEQGVMKIKRLADFLGQAKLEVAAIYHSGKVRAQQTAELLAQRVQSQQAVEVHQGLLPNDEVSLLVEQLNALQEDILLVGHLPYLERLTSQLIVGNDHRQIISFEPGTIACLEKTSHAHWMIHWVLNTSLFSSSASRS